MKTKIVIITILASIIFTACQKEDESKNPYKQNTEETGKTYKLTTEDLKLLPYEVGDTINFRELYQDGYCEDTIDYYIFEKTQTENNIEIKCYIENSSAETAHFILTKDNDNIVLYIDYYDLNVDSTENGLYYTIGKYNTTHYNEITLDSTLYKDVYMTESDTTNNAVHCVYIRKVYYNQTFGIIRIDRECKGYNIY